MERSNHSCFLLFFLMIVLFNRSISDYERSMNPIIFNKIHNFRKLEGLAVGLCLPVVFENGFRQFCSWSFSRFSFGGKQSIQKALSFWDFVHSFVSVKGPLTISQYIVDITYVTSSTYSMFVSNTFHQRAEARERFEP